ncbi:hypothetical protein [Lichenicoccus sp.]|uniref:hypothetical protein n=1 Tax=Lichenicoccus sp. TaxID=2781899 RepID=UPI003D151A08
MTVSDKTKEAVQDTQEQLQSLRAMVEQLLNERVTPALADAAGKAETAVSSARDMTNTQVANVSDKVRHQPLIAIAISTVVGYLLGRISR